MNLKMCGVYPPRDKIQLIKDIIENNATRVIASEETSEPIKLKSGIRQGDLLTYFII